MRLRLFNRLLLILLCIWGVTMAVWVSAGFPPPAAAAAPAPQQFPDVENGAIAFVVDSPTITIAAASANSSASPTTAAREAQINWTFGAVAGTYSTCTVQAQTSVDGTNYLALGSAASVTATSNTVNQWTVIEELGATSVTTSAVSSTAALGFGQLTRYSFSCSSYGTSAPVTIKVVYK